jgi:cyclic beta-1,2-glucan synthetase
MHAADRELDGETLVFTPDGGHTAVALLGDHRYNVMVTVAGGGISRSRDIVVNRWRNDATRDAYGQWCYIRNLDTGRIWSAGFQPLCTPFTEYAADLTSVCAAIRRRDGEIETRTEIVCLPDGIGEARRVSITNAGESPATIELTSYQEVVLAPAINDRGHRAFGNLFVQTEWLPRHHAVLAMRRPRSATEAPRWCGHVVAIDDGTVTCETDRARFLGRGRSSRNPVAMEHPADLTNSVGAVLDPVLALRTTMVLAPKSTRTVVFSTFIADDRRQAADRAAFLSEKPNVQRSIAESLSRGDEVAGRLGIEGRRARKFARAASDLLHGEMNPSAGTRDDLLALGITGELPIVLARVDGEQTRVAELLDLYAYMFEKGIPVDVVFLAATPSLSERLRGVIPSTTEASAARLGGIFVFTGSEVLPSHVSLLESIARIRTTDGSVVTNA